MKKSSHKNGTLLQKGNELKTQMIGGMFCFDHVSKIYPDGFEALKNTNLQINQGELVALIGPSGCGKTTTMKMINHLIQPTKGKIF